MAKSRSFSFVECFFTLSLGVAGNRPYKWFAQLPPLAITPAPFHLKWGISWSHSWGTGTTWLQ